MGDFLGDINNMYKYNLTHFISQPFVHINMEHKPDKTGHLIGMVADVVFNYS